MPSQTEITDILYSKIRSMGRNKIRADIASNVNVSQVYMHNILSECIAKLDVSSRDGNNRDDDRIVVLAEALLHFMLTATTLPSQRKIPVRDNLSIDVIVPNVQTLNRNPDKSIIVQFLSDSLDLKKILQLEWLQPNYKNIWLIYASKPPPYKKYTIYSILPDTSLHKSYSNIIIDITNFLKEKGDKSLRFIH
ncbi:MAG: hypothetical protein ACJ71A_03170 [Nitrososphaeraceae archaeon]